MKMFWQRKCKSYSRQSVNERWKMWMCIRFVFPVYFGCSPSVLFFLSALTGRFVLHDGGCARRTHHMRIHQLTLVSVCACTGWFISLCRLVAAHLLFLSCKRVHRCVIVHSLREDSSIAAVKLTTKQTQHTAYNSLELNNILNERTKKPSTQITA